MTKDIAIVEAEALQGVEESKAEMIKATFDPMIEQLKTFEKQYNSIIRASKKVVTPVLVMKARRLRLDIAKIRHATEHARKAQKEQYLRAGKAIDGVSNIVKWAIADQEKTLQEVEDYYHIREQERLSELQKQRAEMLSQYIDDADERDLSSLDQDVFEALLQAKKKQQEDEAAARIEAAKAEAKRIQEEEAERKRIQEENERLKAEAKERDRLQAIEDKKRKIAEAKAKAQEAVREQKRQKEKEEEERKRIAAEKEAARKLEAIEAKRKAEAAERQKLADQIEERRQADLRKKEEEEARRQAELKKGDADKVDSLVADLIELKTKYSFKSAKYQKTYQAVGELIDKVVQYITK